MIKFPSIEQFRTAIKNVQHRARYSGRDEAGEPIFDGTKLIPTLTLRGTVKLHGTNAGIVYDVPSLQIESYQSRERELTLTSDNAGFMLTMLEPARQAELNDMFEHIIDQNNHWSREVNVEEVSKIVLFGEWCGGNIQKGVGISGLPKMFVIFGIKVVMTDPEDNFWLDLAYFETLEAREQNIYNVLTFGSWTVDVDFNYPQLMQQKLIDLTIAVEEECPAGKFFGNSGVGEGIV